MQLAFKRAEKRQAKLRLAIFGPSGSGKTFTALRVATGLGGPVALIDTERSTASKYADRFEFDALDLDNKTIEDGYIPAISAAAAAKYPVLIIDSLSHGWQELLDDVDQIARAKYRGNTFAAWAEGTPKQRRLVNAILAYPGHVIATMRADTAWDQEKDERTGKVKPVKVGLKPQQGKGIEYEFDMLMEINVEHYATVSKDRTGKFQDKVIAKPGEEFGKALIGWLMEGKPEEKPRGPITPTTVLSPDLAKPEPLAPLEPTPEPTKSAEPLSPPPVQKDLITDFEQKQIFAIAKEKGLSVAGVRAYMTRALGVAETRKLTKAQYAELIAWMQGRAS